MDHTVKIIFFIVALVFIQAGVAESIRIPVGQQAPELQGMTVPQRGMSKETVVRQFGEPESRSAAVGEPPISHWNYPQYRVYFESDRVIHTVLEDPSLR